MIVMFSSWLSTEIAVVNKEFKKILTADRDPESGTLGPDPIPD